MTESHASTKISKVYYVDVGNLPKEKAEAYVREMMEKHRERIAKN
jgi:polyhydroxyalkanoate synthesis regulator phasin